MKIFLEDAVSFSYHVLAGEQQRTLLLLGEIDPRPRECQEFKTEGRIMNIAEFLPWYQETTGYPHMDLLIQSEHPMGRSSASFWRRLSDYFWPSYSFRSRLERGQATLSSSYRVRWMPAFHTKEDRIAAFLSNSALYFDSPPSLPRLRSRLEPLRDYWRDEFLPHQDSLLKTMLKRLKIQKQVDSISSHKIRSLLLRDLHKEWKEIVMEIREILRRLDGEKTNDYVPQHEYNLYQDLCGDTATLFMLLMDTYLLACVLGVSSVKHYVIYVDNVRAMKYRAFLAKIKAKELFYDRTVDRFASCIDITGFVEKFMP